LALDTGAWLRHVTVTSSLLLLACTPASGPTGPVTVCQSWTTLLAPRSVVGQPEPVIDRSSVPARTDLRVGARLSALVVIVGRSPNPCGGPIDQPTGWRTDPAVLGTDSTWASGATFVGLAPGTTQVLALVPRPEGSGGGAVELSVCADPAKSPDDPACARTPLTIRVVP